MTIPTEAIQYGADIVRAHQFRHSDFSIGRCSCGHRTDRRDHPLHVAAEFLTAALPHIRAQLAQEIRAECDLLDSDIIGEHVRTHVMTGLNRAARIVEGKQ